MILFLLVFSALQTLSSGQYATDINDCIRNGVNVSSDSIISERNLTRDTCGFLMQANDYIVVQINKVNISEDSRIRLYLIISTNDSIIKHEVSEFYNESVFRNSVFIGAGRQTFALVVLSKTYSTEVGEFEFEFVFRTRCSVELVAEDFPTFTSPNYFLHNKTLDYALNNNLRDQISCSYKISSRRNRPFVVRFTSYQNHSGMRLVIDDLHVEGKSQFAFSGDKSVNIRFEVIKGNETLGGFRAAVDINQDNFILEPHHHHGFMLYNNAVVCHNSFHVSNAKVYCRYLGYPGVRNIYQNSSFHTTGRSVVNLQCDGSETSPANCSVSFAERCEVTPINGVICQDVALAGGNDTNEGRVEIYYKGRRGLLCDDFFDMNSGNVICRQLGFRSAVKMTSSASSTYGYGNGVFLLDDLKCKGHETSIHKCYSKNFVIHNCNRNEVSGLVCSHKDQDIFMLEPHHHHGFMIYDNAVVCQNSFNMTNAKIYCRSLGYPGVRKLYQNSSFHTIGRSVVNLQCTGSETSPTDCHVSPATQCEGTLIYGVICQDVALAGGSHTNEGHVEIYYKGRRGLLCDDLFDMNSGNVICRQLGFRSAVKVKLGASSTYGYGNGVFLLNDLKCKGHENSIHECHSKNFLIHNCNMSEVSGLVCSQKDLEIFSLAPHHHQGFMLHNNRVVCQNSFNLSNAKVYCLYLGYPGIRNFYQVSPSDIIGRPTVYLQCNGSENSPADCQVELAANCKINSTIGVVCQDVALAGGKDTNEGRVEIYYKGRRGLLCNTNFNMESGNVICRQLGFRSAVIVPAAYKIFGSGNGPFLIDNLRCNGFEESIHECPSNSIGNYDCQRRQMVGLVCSHQEPAMFSLVPNHHEGLLLYDNYFVCQNDFNMNIAKVYCRYLGFPGVIKLYQNLSLDTSGHQSVYLKCNGPETSPAQCDVTVATNCTRSSLLGVVCQDVALARGKDTKEGRVEIYYEERRAYMCYVRSQMESGNVICKQLGFRFAVNISLNANHVNDLDNRRYRSIDLRCLGNESSIHECEWSLSYCDREHISHLVCSEKDPNTFSLVPHHHQGFMLYNNSVVCQNSFNATNAMVYCRYLGYPGVRMLYPNSSFDITGRSTVNLQCNGSETSPAECRVIHTKTCKETSTVGVVCQDVGRLNKKEKKKKRFDPK